jgi:LPXTG-site transpeptidase (sortase) family protein
LLAVFYYLDSFYKERALLPRVTSGTLYEQEIARGELPIRLKIPRLEVDATIEYVGLTLKGAMDVPKGPLDVAWLDLGPRPGEIGSAVIAGHRGWKNGQVAIFDHLDKLRKGDNIYVETVGEKSIAFVIREIRVYDFDAYAPEVFSSADGIHLNLVTCVGVWDTLLRRSSERLVVFADIVE